MIKKLSSREFIKKLIKAEIIKKTIPRKSSGPAGLKVLGAATEGGTAGMRGLLQQ